MDLETPSTDHVRATDAPEDQKYHPLILQQTFNTQLSTTIDRIDSQEKQSFFQKLHDTFRGILTCSKCDSVLEENSVGFSCGHTFCKKCAVTSDSCLNCQNDGCKNGSKIKNLSGILADITNLKTNFNQESVFFELIKFLITPASMIVKREPAHNKVDGGTPVLPPSDSTSTKSRGKFTSTGKRFKTVFDKTYNTKRKLLFNKNEADSPTQTQLLENDSESLFMDASNKTRVCKPEKVTSYLAVQSSIDESPKFDTTNLKTYSRSAKRKLVCVDLAGNATEKVVDDRNAETGSGIKKRKLKASVAELSTDETSGTAGNSAKRKRSNRTRRMSDMCDVSSEMKKTNRVAESCESKSSTPASGTLPRRTSRRASSKITLDEPLDLKPEDQEKLPADVQDPPHVSKPTEASGECINVIGYDRKKKQFNIKRRSHKVTEKGADVQPDGETKESEKGRQVEEGPKAAGIENHGTERNCLSSEPTKLKNVKEVLNTSYHQNPSREDTKTDMKVDLPKYNDETEKENFGVTFADVDADDVVDVNLWDRVEKANRKKKSLFKAVKERNKKNVLLKLLEEKALRRENEKKDNPETSEDGVSPAAPTTANSSVAPEVEPSDNQNSPERTHAVDPIGLNNAVKVVNEHTSDSGRSSVSVSSYTYTPLLPEENNELLTSDSGNTSITPAPLADCQPSAQSPDVLEVSIPRREDLIDIPVPVHPQTSQVCPQDLRSPNELTVSLTRIDSDCHMPTLECNSAPSSSLNQCESTLTPVSKRAKFMYSDSRGDDSPQLAGTCSLVMDSESAVVGADVRGDAMPNTSTPILDKYSRLCEDESKPVDPGVDIHRSIKKLPTYSQNSNGEESLANESSSSIVIRTQRSSIQPPTITCSRTGELTEEAVADDTAPPETVSQLNVKLKCANLKRAINKQNQKMLTSLHRDFGVMSPPVLSIAKGRLDKHCSPAELNAAPPFSISSSENKEKGDVSEESSADLRLSDNPLNKVQNLPLSELDDVLTVPGSPARKSVSCQTTPELHIALLMREFPHLFQRADLPLSVYDTPVESTIANGAPAKTPDLRTSLLVQHDRFTRVSSVTSSEKKLFEREFADRSVLYDSFRTPAGGIGVADERVDLSCIALLPSSTKKAPESESQDSDKRKLSVRLNFQDVKPSVAELCESPAANTEDVISIHDTTYCSGLKSRSLNSSPQEADDEKQNGLSNASNEIEFADVSAAQPAKTTPGSAGNAGADLSVSMVMDTNVSVIPDTNAPCGEDFELFADDESKEKSVEDADEATGRKSVEVLDVNVHGVPGGVEENGCKSPEANVDVDDEDVDFVAGTPTCYSKRCPDNSFEMLQSQSIITRPGDFEQLSLANKSNLLFDSLDYRTLKTQSSLAVDVSAVSVPSRVSTAKSVDLFNSDSMASMAPPVHVTTSGLKEADNRIVKLFCEKFSAVLLDRLTDKTTHLVVRTDANNETARTFKYLQAIVNCVRVVSINWLDECLRRGCVVDEERYIPLDSSGECGPLRAFNVSRNVTPSPLSWLRDYCVFFVEPVPQGCTLSQLQEIIVKAGAVVVNSLKEMKKYPSHHRVIIVSEDDDNVEISNEEIANWLQMYQAVAIEFNWLLEVIGRNRLVPFAEYEVVEIPEELLLKFNFPRDMLQVED